jgi:hypothetical protein
MPWSTGGELDFPATGFYPILSGPGINLKLMGISKNLKFEADKNFKPEFTGSK